MAIVENWKIRKRLGQCSETSEPFEDGEVFYTAIFPEEEGDGYERRDYCADAWNKLQSKLKPFSYWRSRYEAPPAEEDAEEAVGEDAEGLLRRLIEEDKPETDNARFILAAMLERRKVLRETDVRETENEVKVRFYEHRVNGDVLVVRDPNLRLDQVADVQVEVAWLLEGKDPEEERRKLAEAESGEGEADLDGEEAAEAQEGEETAPSESEDEAGSEEE